MFGIGVAELTIVMVFGIPLVAIIGGISLAALQILKGGRGAGDDQPQGNESRIIQQIYQGLERLEERVESLETLVLEHDKKENRS